MPVNSPSDVAQTPVIDPVPDDRRVEAFRPIKLRKAADVVIAVLADAIRGGLYEPGDLLPSERTLAAQLQVSRHVLREAIDVLRREGILAVKRGRAGGITVISDKRLLDVVASLRGETHDLMHWTLEVRRSLELPGFLLTARKATDADLEALRPLVEKLEELEASPEDFYALDRQFHLQVVRLSGNPLLADFYKRTLDQLAEIRQEFPVLQVRFDQAVRNQHALYAALLTRDPARIESAVDEHLAATEIVYLGRPI
jgi:GntR family transcriptional repressor for pyruvate dehydrogenase complex